MCFNFFFPGAETIIIRWIMEYNIRYSIKPFSSILPIQRLRMYCLIAWFFFLLMERKWWILSFLSILFARDREREIEKKMQATRMRCRPQSRAPAPRWLRAAVPFSFTCNQFCRRHSMGRDAGFLFSFFRFVHGFYIYSMQC